MINDNRIANSLTPLHILLADDDSDDRYFFEKVISTMPNPAKLSTVNDGEELIIYLEANWNQLPDILFLDLNMPKKNGSECLLEIKKNQKLERLPVIIYSTSLSKDVADILYANGAHFYIRKTDMTGLRKMLNHVLLLLSEKTFARPTRDKFVLSAA